MPSQGLHKSHLKSSMGKLGFALTNFTFSAITLIISEKDIPLHNILDIQ
jgi:hypothetical protein